MLTKFRNLYPQGSILSELIDIDRGIYIVRVSIEINGVTLATGLAGADTVEKAEDNARNRALQALVLEDGHLSLNLASQALQEIAISQPKVAPEITAAPQTNHLPVAEIPEKIAPRKTAPAATKIAAPDKTIPEQIQPQIIEEPIQTSLLNEVPVSNNKISEPEPTLSAPEPILSAPEPEMPIGILDNREEMLEPPLELTAPDEDYVTQQPPAPEKVAEFDFNQIRHKIDLEMKRLSWTKEQGRDYLLSTYGKRSRLHLTDDELLEFWHYLETLPN